MQIEQEIRDFLMTRRARITPEQAGLTYVGSHGRRVAGLRREEVTMLAGLSVEYDTRIERVKPTERTWHETGPSSRQSLGGAEHVRRARHGHITAV